MGAALSDLETSCACKCCGADTNNESTIASPQQTVNTDPKRKNVDIKQMKQYPKSESNTKHNQLNNQSIKHTYAEIKSTEIESTNIENTDNNDILDNSNTENTLSQNMDSTNNQTPAIKQNITYSPIEFMEASNTEYSVSNIDTIPSQNNSIPSNYNINENVTEESMSDEDIVKSSEDEIIATTNKKRIMFLDIDGVLNDKKSPPRTVKPDALMKLKKIINETQCKIVLSSSWRRVDELKHLFKKQFNKITEMDIDDVYIGDTPSNGRNPTRVHEIMEYFDIMEQKEAKKHSDINWVVIDDMDLLNEGGLGLPSKYKQIMDGHWVRTKIQTGLTDQNVEQIISILNEE